MYAGGERGGYMKRILILTLILLFGFTIPVFAADNDEEIASQKVIDALKEIRYAITAGTNYKNYSELVQKAGIEYQRFNDKYPKSETPAHMAFFSLDYYKVAMNVWREGLFGRYAPLVHASDITRIPAVLKKLTPAPGAPNFYHYKEALPEIWKFAFDAEKYLEPKNQNKQEQ